jgi:hypothetical protein
MQTESLGKMLPRILFPYVQQWAERSGMTLVSRLLVDEQFRGLLEKYGDEIMSRVAQANYRPATAGSQGNEQAEPPCADPRASDPPINGNSLAKLQDRVLAMEAQEPFLRFTQPHAAFGAGPWLLPRVLGGCRGLPEMLGAKQGRLLPAGRQFAGGAGHQSAGRARRAAGTARPRSTKG